MTIEEHKRQEQLATGLTRTLLYLKLASIESTELREVLRLSPLKYVAPFAKELVTKLVQSERKAEWFIETVKKTLGEQNFSDTAMKAVGAQNLLVLERDLQPGSEKLCNLSQLTEWLLNTSGNTSNAIDLITSSAVRRDLLLRAWRTALDSPELSELNMLRFNAWYNANFPR